MKKLILARRLSQIFFLFLFVYILWSASRASLLFKIDPFVSLFTSLGALALTFILGRFFCGWICPLGSIIDAIGIKTKNRNLNLAQIKYYILGTIVVLAILGIQIAWVFDPLVINETYSANIGIFASRPSQQSGWYIISNRKVFVHQGFFEQICKIFEKLFI